MDPVELMYLLSRQPGWLVTALSAGASFAVGLLLGIRLR